MKLIGKVEKFEEVVWQSKGNMSVKEINYALKEMSTNIEEAMELLEEIDARVDLVYGLGDISNLLSNLTFEEPLNSIKSIYAFGTESAVRGIFPLTQEKVLEFYIDLKRLNQHDKVGECCIMTLEDHLMNESEDVKFTMSKLYKCAKKFDPNPFIKKDCFYGVFDIEQISDEKFVINNTDLRIDFFEGILDGNMDVSLRTVDEYKEEK